MTQPTAQPVGVSTRSLTAPNPIIHRLRQGRFGWATACNGGRAEPVDPHLIVGRQCPACRKLPDEL